MNFIHHFCSGHIYGKHKQNLWSCQWMSDVKSCGTFYATWRPGALRKYYAFHWFELLSCTKGKTHREMRGQMSKVGFSPNELWRYTLTHSVQRLSAVHWRVWTLDRESIRECLREQKGTDHTCRRLSELHACIMGVQLMHWQRLQQIHCVWGHSTVIPVH